MSVGIRRLRPKRSESGSPRGRGRHPSFSAFGALAVLVASLFALGCGGPDLQPNRRNVVLILVDTLRADHLRSYGYDRSTSPRFDALARHGFVFEQARSQAGCTFPSVNSLLTSRWPQPFVQGMRDHGLGIPAHYPTLAQILGDAGYKTHAISSSTIVRANPSRPNPDGGFEAGFDHFDDDCLWKPASCVYDRAIEFLATAPEPFFLYLHFLDPHMPFQPPESHQRVFAKDYEGKDWVADGRLLPLNEMLYEDGPPVDFSERDLAHAIDLYDDEIRYFDSQLAEFLEQPSVSELFESSIVVFSSDHGEELLDHGSLFHCRDLAYDTIVKTPLVLWIPEIRGGGRSDALAQNMDIVPTLLDYLGMDPGQYPLDGKTLRPVIEQGHPVHRWVFGSQRYSRSVTDGRYKLILNIKTGEVELFDLELDPGEQRDIHVRRKGVAEELTKVLLRWIETVEGGSDLEERVDRANEVTERLRAVGYL